MKNSIERNGLQILVESVRVRTNRFFFIPISKLCLSRVTVFRWNTPELKSETLRLLPSAFIASVRVLTNRKIFIQLFCCLFLIQINISSAQDLSKQIDSVKITISKMTADTLKVKALNDAAWNFKTKDAKLSKQFSSEAYALALKLNYLIGQIEALNLTGNVNDNQGDYPLALSNYRKALLLANQSKAKKNIAGLTNNIGLVFEHIGETDSALGYYQKALVLKKEIGNKASIASTLNNIGNSYWVKSNYNKALEFHFQSLKIKEELGDKKMMASSYHNIANIYLDMRLYNLSQDYENKSIAIRLTIDDFWGLGTSYNTLALVFYNQKIYAKAIDAFNKAIDYSNRVEDSVNLGKIFSGLSSCYFQMKNIEQALAFELKAVEIQKSHTDIKGLSVSYNHLGKIFLEQNKSEEARHWYRQSVLIGKKLDNKKVIAESLEGISDTYLKENRLDSALFFLRSFAMMKDSVIDESRIKEIAGLQIRYETEVKQREIDSLNLQKARNNEQLLSAAIEVQHRNYLLLASFILLVVGGIAFQLYRKNQKTKLASEKAKAILETEISERNRIARDMHDELGSGLSKISIAQQFAKENTGDKKILNENLSSIGKATTELVASMGDLIWSLNTDDNTLDALLARIRSHASDYLDEAGVNYEINIQHDLPNHNLYKECRHHLYLTFKEALNNAVKYSGATLITITVTLKEDVTQSLSKSFQITITDNGNGFSVEEKLRKGNGLQNMQQRMQAINGKINIKSGIGNGTSIELTVSENKLFNTAV